ncbi:antitoxin component YwqK of YwqJK toxin-antitoxin module [Saonia flava]|uniref:Antitoxin component YwqK of YwqJK toxin-antitoxin module n=1 Tax=Saonia flava TaxID=523696 RepID=A0A846QVH4_9FLAO|nr:hypothetical protein [Saonia flava]NJB72904.1 antitoxin component YwqK of YwqJK toxin-antitoxin module [Saonia flava]NJB72916.1 antitoxin component YwqK of YwqJK toxin-antitoxin module [Saonia flava]
MKTASHIIIVLILQIGTWSVCGQKSFHENILGTWVHEKPDKNPEFLLDSEDSPKSTKKSISLYYFQKDRILDIKKTYGQFKTDYSISDSTLNLGVRKYKIIEFTQNKLLVEEFGDLVIFKKKLEFKRTDKRIEPIPAREKIIESYKNGNPKISGEKQNGFENGIWTEWYENGHVKSVIYYNMGAPLMTAKFNNKGKLISENWFDLYSNSVRTN